MLKGYSMIDIWRLRKLFLAFSLIFLLGAGEWGSAPLKPDCSKCETIEEDLQALKKKAADELAELQKEQDLVKKMSLDQASKKTQMTSKLFVLAAQSEIAQNVYSSKEKDWKFNCSKCGKKKISKKSK